MPLENLTRARVVEALNLLGQLAGAENVSIELCIYGGSALMLAYDQRETTKDVDAIARPSEVVLRLSAVVAQRLGLDERWLNDDVKRFISQDPTFAPLQIEQLEEAARRHLKITRPSAAYLLAMKCLAFRSPLPGRRGDLEDIQFLIGKMGITTIEEVEQQIERFYPHDVLTTPTRSRIESLLPKQKGERQ